MPLSHFPICDEDFAYFLGEPDRDGLELAELGSVVIQFRKPEDVFCDLFDRSGTVLNRDRKRNRDF